MIRNKAVFLDKDGTLINDIPYNVDPDLITLSKDSIEGLRLLQEYGYQLIIITNQAGIAFGYFTEAQLLQVKEKIYALLGEAGISVHGFYYCPHHKDGITAKYALTCSCRKPKPGLLLKAANDLNIDLSESWMIGDILHDVEAGERAGCRTILIDNGNETEWTLNEYRIPEKQFENINKAAAYIISSTKHERQLERM